MKKILLTVIVASAAMFSHAATFFDQLVEFNFNWAHYQSRVPEMEAVEISSDKVYIQTHLTQVLKILRSNPTDHLTDEQLANREHLINVLEGYKDVGLFPMNYYRPERIPVFIDEHNTHCAVGYLLQQTGYEDVARRIAAKDNYAWVKDIDDPALPVWQELSGFTLDELKLIQGAYDSYIPMAFTLPNRTEIPQKPEVVVRDFNGNVMKYKEGDDLMKIWCYGEGTDSVLHGRWVQNYAKDIPWIEGYYENGKRTGSWKEYYQGTNILCRTEHWRNDKLNGVRTRYDREGNVIERITFKDGDAVLKINYDLQGGLQWNRRPLAGDRVSTEVYTDLGYLLAKGEEVIYNPSGLQWFQNIELTALNTAAITARDGAPTYVSQSQPGFLRPAFSQSNDALILPRHSYASFQQPSLVQYYRVGEWKFYNEYTPDYYMTTATTTKEYLERDFPHFGSNLAMDIRYMNLPAIQQTFDSLTVTYENNRLRKFEGHGNATARLLVNYHDDVFSISALPRGYNGLFRLEEQRYYPVAAIGEIDENGARIGNWYNFDAAGMLIKKEEYIIPWLTESDKLANGPE